MRIISHAAGRALQQAVAGELGKGQQSLQGSSSEGCGACRGASSAPSPCPQACPYKPPHPLAPDSTGLPGPRHKPKLSPALNG